MAIELNTREDLINTLHLAAELEHNLMCQYLFAAYSMKRSTSEGLDEVQLEKTRGWGALMKTRVSQLNILRRWWDLSQGGKPIDRRAHQLTLQAYGWAVDINGTVHENKIGADENTTWPLSFWMGGWDGDALCAYISGYLSIPMAGGA